MLEVNASLPATDEDLKAMVKRGADEARLKFKQLTIGPDSVVADAEAELNTGFAAGTARIEKENFQMGTRSNEAWLRSQWAMRVEGKLKELRDRFSAGQLSQAELAEAETFIKARVEELRSAYASEGVGPSSCREKPWEEVVDRHMQASLREVASWRSGGGCSDSFAEEKAATAANERKRLDEEAAKLAAQVAKEVEESKIRTEKMQQQRRTDDEGVENWDTSDRAGADPSKVELREKPKDENSATKPEAKPSAKDSEAKSSASGSKDKVQQKKCCSVQ